MQGLELLLEGISTALIHGRRHRRLNTTEKSFYATLLNFGGPLVMQVIIDLAEQLCNAIRDNAIVV